MKDQHIRKERGQILVMLAATIVGLFGFAALAIDGGIIFSDRRFDQSAADAAALAGAGKASYHLQANSVDILYFKCSDTRVIAAMNQAYTSAQASATSNGFTLDTDLSDGYGVQVTCNDTAAIYKNITVRVMITADVKTSFAHFFYPGPIRNTVSSETRVTPITDLGWGNTLVSLNKTCDGSVGGVSFDGNNTVTIDTGGVFSNSCLETVGTSLHVKIKNGGINYRTEHKLSGSPSIYPGPTKATEEFPFTPVPTPSCPAGSPISFSTSGDETISPGNYSKITQTSKTDILRMEPGLYCLTGDMTINGGSIIGNGITIYMKKDGTKDTNLQIGGNAGGAKNEDIATIDLRAPAGPVASNTCYDPGEYDNICPPAIKGMLIYMAPGNKGNITLQGNSSSVFSGTILAQDGSVDLGGNSNTKTVFGVQVIADTVKLHGTVVLNVYNDSENVVTNPAQYDQFK